MQCRVYKSLRLYDYFLFVETSQGMSRVPEALRRLLGQLEPVMDLELHPGRKLAQADAPTVMRQVADQGYYLQMPADRKGAPLVS